MREDDEEDEAEAWSRLLCPDAAPEADEQQHHAASRRCGGDGGGSTSAGLGCCGMRAEDLIDWLRSRTEVRPFSSLLSHLPRLPRHPLWGTREVEETGRRSGTAELVPLLS